MYSAVPSQGNRIRYPRCCLVLPPGNRAQSLPGTAFDQWAILVYVSFGRSGKASAVHASGILFLPGPLNNSEFMPENLQQPLKYRREVLRVEGLSDTELAALAAAKPPAWTQ